MAPSYRAVDNDPRLTAIAREAVPLIIAIDEFYSARGSCPQPHHVDEFAAFTGRLTSDYSAEIQGQFVLLRRPHDVPGWVYTSTAQGACSLWRKLGWDPALIWWKSREGEAWIFDPGDGSDERPLRLDPGGH